MLNFDKKQQAVFLILIVLIIIESGFILSNRSYLKKADKQDSFIVHNETENNGNNTGNNKDKKVEVYVTGEVNKPGVVSLTEDSRVEDAVKSAGGLTDKADINSINLARKVVDGEAIKIPDKNSDNKANGSRSSDSTNDSSTDKININTADADTLDKLPGIGPSRAKKIIQYREKNGPFKTIDDLKNIGGIGDRMFNNLKDSITVN